MNNQTFPPPQGPEYTPCACSHIEPEHDINGRWCAIDGCECNLYRPVVEAGQAPPTTDRAALRDRVAAAIWERQNPGRRWVDCEYRWRADAEADADAVLAVLPATVDRAAVLREAAELGRELSRQGYSAQEIARKLDRMADEAQPAIDTASDTPQHACRNCEGIDPDTCLMNPDRPAVEAQPAQPQTGEARPGEGR
ncbi:hypothetical protein RKD49_002124 [Streptomyces glaucescens]